MILSIIGRGWRTVAVSEVGASHLKDDLPCQDACRVHVTPSTLIACVADGAGSGKHSAIGSRAAVNAFVSESANLLRTRVFPGKTPSARPSKKRAGWYRWYRRSRAMISGSMQRPCSA